MNIEDIEKTLPNGFHDSYVNNIKIDFKKREAEIDIKIDYSSIDRNEISPIYCNGKLILKRLFLFVFDPPNINILDLFPLWVSDSDILTPEIYPEWLKKMEKTIDKNLIKNCYYFYYINLNCYMYIGANEVEWILENEVNPNSAPGKKGQIGT
jgi:hypothetical protein